jgi:hypothetical protein
VQWTPPDRLQLLSEPIDCSQRPFPSILAQRGRIDAQQKAALGLCPNVAGIPRQPLDYANSFVCCYGLLALAPNKRGKNRQACSHPTDGCD